MTDRLLEEEARMRSGYPSYPPATRPARRKQWRYDIASGIVAFTVGTVVGLVLQWAT